MHVQIVYVICCLKYVLLHYYLSRYLQKKMRTFFYKTWFLDIFASSLWKQIIRNISLTTDRKKSNASVLTPYLLLFQNIFISSACEVSLLQTLSLSFLYLSLFRPFFPWLYPLSLYLFLSQSLSLYIYLFFKSVFANLTPPNMPGEKFSGKWHFVWWPHVAKSELCISGSNR